MDDASQSSDITLTPVDHDPFASDAPASSPPSTLQAYQPSWRDRIASWMMGDGSASPERRDFVSGLLGSTGLGTTGPSVSDLTPAGGIFAGQEAARQGDYQGAAMAGLGILPGVGAVEREAASLPMDTASRLARAKSMGFMTNLQVYHGSNAEFSSLRAAPTSGAGLASPGVSVALDPAVANEYALAKQGNGQTSPQVYPLLHRASNPAVLTLQGTEKQGEVAATLANAFDSGHDSVMLKNYTTPGGQAGKNIIIVKDPSQLRSPFAAFDPAKKNSADLLSSIAGIGTGTGLAAYALTPVHGDPFAPKESPP